MHNRISGWVRQSRHRAKKRGVPSDISAGEVGRLVAELGGACAYCGRPSTTLDHPFPVGGGAPNVMANILPCCDACKEAKGVTDMIAFAGGGMPKDKLMPLLTAMLERRGGSLLREHIKSITGIGL